MEPLIILNTIASPRPLFSIRIVHVFLHPLLQLILLIHEELVPPCPPNNPCSAPRPAGTPAWYGPLLLPPSYASAMVVSIGRRSNDSACLPLCTSPRRCTPDGDPDTSASRTVSAEPSCGSSRHARLKVSTGAPFPTRLRAMPLDGSGSAVSLLRFNVCKVLCFRAAGAARQPGWFKNSSAEMLLPLLVMLPQGDNQVKPQAHFVMCLWCFNWSFYCHQEPASFSHIKHRDK